MLTIRPKDAEKLEVKIETASGEVIQFEKEAQIVWSNSPEHSLKIETTDSKPEAEIRFHMDTEKAQRHANEIERRLQKAEQMKENWPETLNIDTLEEVEKELKQDYDVNQEVIDNMTLYQLKQLLQEYKHG